MKKIIFLLFMVFAFSCKTEVQNTPQAQDTTLKRIVIKRNSGLAKTISPVPASCNYELKKDISSENYLHVEAVANDSKATIHFDRKPEHSTSQRYTRYKPKIFILVKNGDSSSTYTINIEKPKEDISLQSLIVKQGEAVVKTFKTPIDKTNSVKLTKVVNGINYLTVEAKPKDNSCNVYFDDEDIAKTKKDYTEFQAQIKIKVKKGKEEKEYTLSIEEPEDETGIQNLVIKQGDAILKNLSSSIPKVINVDLIEKVTNTKFVMLEVTPKASDAQVFFDGTLSSNKTKKYESYQKLVKIVVKKSGKQTEYEVKLREPSVPVPQDYSVKCNVVDSLGGTNVSGASVKVYEVGKTTFLEEKTTDAEGNAYFTVAGDKYYDVVCSKAGSAGSRVESMYVPLNKRIFLPIIMRDGAKGALAIAPEVVEMSVRHGGKETPIDKNYELDVSQITVGTAINITVKSKSKRIIPDLKTDSQNFGVAVSLTSPFSTNSLGEIPVGKVPNTSGRYIVIDPDGTVIQKFSVNCTKLLSEDGEKTLYFTIYDIAGNRCERHQRITFKNTSFINQSENPNNSFSEFSAYSQRYYRSLETFGMNEEEGAQTSARVIFLFKFAPRMDVAKIELMRRPFQKGSPTENWEVVYAKHYEQNFKGDKDGLFQLSDDSGTLRDGEVYQYKLEAYNSKGRVTSPIATIKIMEAFNITLTNPKNRAELSLAEIANQDFAFKISKKSLWTDSDYFYFDILIHAEDIYPTLNDLGLMFASMLKYQLQGQKDLEIGKYYDQWRKSRVYKNYKTYNPATTNLEMLVNYNDGVVTITNKFFNEANFNIANKTLANSINKAGMYYWDIMDIGKNPLGVRDLEGNVDDKAAYFVKEYPYLDSRTGKPVGTEKSRSYSYSNLDIIGGAVNGKALFIVK